LYFFIVFVAMPLPPLFIGNVQPLGVIEAAMWIAWLLVMAELANSKQMQVRFVPRVFRRSVKVVNMEFEIGPAAQLAFPIVALENL
jgi:hypothetical protein